MIGFGLAVRHADDVKNLGARVPQLAQRAGSLSHMGWLTGSLGDTLFRLGRLEESEALQREALDLAVRVGDEPLRAMRMNALGADVLFRGRLGEAEPILLAAASDITKAVAVPAWGVAAARKRLADLYDAWKKPTEAAKWR